jgi:hypothetical protein
VAVNCLSMMSSSACKQFCACVQLGRSGLAGVIARPATSNYRRARNLACPGETILEADFPRVFRRLPPEALSTLPIPLSEHNLNYL